MLSLFLPLLVLFAAAPAQTLSAPDWAVEIPRQSALQGPLAFFAKAGERSALLRPENWLENFHPFLPLNPTDPESLREAGVDLEGPMVLSGRGKTRMSCLRLSSVPRFEERARERLSALGQLEEKKRGRSKRVIARADGARVAGYALLGSVACAVASESQGNAAMREATAAVGVASRPASSAIRVWLPKGEATLRGAADRLLAEGRWVRRVAPFPWGRAPGRMRARAPSGLLFLRGSFDSRGLAELAEPDMLSLCGACERAPLHRLLQALADACSGELFWRVDGLKPKPDFSTRAGELRALVHAGAFEVDHPDALTRGLGPLVEAAGGHAEARRWVLPLEGGDLTLQLEGSLLWFSNDARALATLRGSPPAAPTSFLGMEAQLEGLAAARALGQISILDLLRRPALAPVAMAGMELGPLLEATMRITLRLTPVTGGTTRFILDWRLR